MIVASVTMMDILRGGKRRGEVVGSDSGTNGCTVPLLRVQILRIEKRNDQRKSEVCDDRNFFVEVFDTRIQLSLPHFVDVLQY